MIHFDPYQESLKNIDQEITNNRALLDDPELSSIAMEEIEKLEILRSQLLQAQQQSDFNAPTSINDNIDQAKVIVEIRSGTGGEEAKIWAMDLQRMYLRFCERQKLKAEFLDENIIKISGKTKVLDLYPYQLLRYEAGVHRVQRIPTTEAQGRIHTSTASVAILPEITTRPIEIKDSDLEWQFIRAGGAGGQHVNKTSSAVRLTHVPSGIVVTSSQERQQIQNRKFALDLLYSKLWEIEQEKKQNLISKARSSIGRNMRAEKIRTYNYPQNRITDHRFNISWYNLQQVMEGALETMLTSIHTHQNHPTQNFS